MLSSPFSKPRITPPAEHPRLMLKKEDIPRIRQNLQTPACSLSAALWQQLLEKPVRCIGATPDYGTYDLSEYIAVEAKALQALLSGSREDARTAIDDLLLLLQKPLHLLFQSGHRPALLPRLPQQGKHPFLK